MKILKELISLHGKGKSTCSPEVSLVNHLASLDNERERMITAISGRKCLESYERQDRSGLLARMLLESPIWFNPVVKLTWKRKVIKMKKITRKRYLSKNISSIPSATILNVKDIPSNRSLFQLAVSERHINGIGYGSLLPTVQTQGLKVCDKDGKTRFMDLSSLPKQGIKYGDLLPTPVASDHTGSCTIRKMTKSNGAPRTDSLRNMPAVIGMDGDRLNGRVFQQSPICRGNDGLPFNVDNLTIPYGKWRKESIKAYGNAIVPLIAVKIFEMINKIERYEQQTTL